MSHHKKISLLVATVILAPRLMSAANFAVGTCLPQFKSFSTISAAVSSVPPGSSIHICPGVYPEQVNILQPLTLQGVQYNNTDRVVITVPSPGPSSGGLVVNAIGTTGFAGGAVKFAAQVLVRTAGPVIIADITVDGTGGNMGCTFTDPSAVWLAGIFYATGSSGTVNRVTTRNQIDNSGPGYIDPCGVGIWAEDSTDPNQTFTIKNSNAHDFDSIGIFVGTDGSQERQFAPTIIGNDVDDVANVGGWSGIVSSLATSTIDDNVVHGGLGGIQISNHYANGATTITNNTIAGVNVGILTDSDANIRSNRVSDADIGIWVDNGDGNTIESNHIFKTRIAIENDCHATTIGAAGNGNGIYDAGIGVDQAPPGFTNINTFHNVDTVVVPCGP